MKVSIQPYITHHPRLQHHSPMMILGIGGCQLTTIVVSMHIKKPVIISFTSFHLNLMYVYMSCMYLCLVTLYLRGTFERLRRWNTHAKTVIPNVKMHQLADI